MVACSLSSTPPQTIKAIPAIQTAPRVEPEQTHTRVFAAATPGAVTTFTAVWTVHLATAGFLAWWGVKKPKSSSQEGKDGTVALSEIHLAGHTILTPLVSPVSSRPSYPTIQ